MRAREKLKHLISVVERHTSERHGGDGKTTKVRVIVSEVERRVIFAGPCCLSCDGALMARHGAWVGREEDRPAADAKKGPSKIRI